MRTLEMRVSRNGGHTWSDWRVVSIGELGDYRKRVRSRRFGLGQNWCLHIRLTAAVRCDLLGVIVDSTP